MKDTLDGIWALLICIFIMLIVHDCSGRKQMDEFEKKTLSHFMFIERELKLIK